MDLIARNNIRVINPGAAKTIMFSHGYGCDQQMWRYITPAFADRYTIVLFDHVGSGKSDQKAYDKSKYGTLNGYAEDIIQICEFLNLKQVIFVGHSVSAIIGALASIAAPLLFEKLIMICPSPCYINKDDYLGGFSETDINELMDALESNYLGWSANIAPVIMGNSDRPELGEELATAFCQNNPEIAKHFAKTTFLSDNRADLSKISVKTFILQCTEDLIAPAKVGKFVNENIENSEIVLLNATGHCPNLSAPIETIKAIKSFLS